VQWAMHAERRVWRIRPLGARAGALVGGHARSVKSPDPEGDPQHSLALLDVRRVLGRALCVLGRGRRGLGRAVFDVPLLLPAVDSLAARVLTFFLGIPACAPGILTVVAAFPP
jgi:hypothetical protein